MVIIRSIQEMQRAACAIRHKGLSIGFVPTMGALHAGHISLIRQAHKNCGKVIVSIFVNPAQFGPKEDFKRYPRNLKNDAALCKKEGVDFIFYPDAGKMYPPGYRTYVVVEDLSDRLCGKFRPGHFKGVATVVTKLFNIVMPDEAYFGQKDAQQALIIAKMVEDLNIPIKVKIMPTIREYDGLALSSRNAYLNNMQRDDALVLAQALYHAKDLMLKGTKDSHTIINSMRKRILKKKSAKIDYIALVNPETLEPKTRAIGRCLIALAVWIGKTRLIDNILVNSE